MIEIYTKNECHLVKLGQVFAATYLRPVLESSASPSSLIIGLYGPSGIGKSPLISGCLEEWASNPPFSFNQDGLVEESTAGDFLFRFCDFGKFAHIPTVRMPHIAPRTARDVPGIDFYEHPPFSTLGLKGAIVTIREVGYETKYGNVWRQWLDDIAENSKPHQNAVRELLTAAFPLVANEVGGDRLTNREKRKISSEAARCVSIITLGDSESENIARRSFEQRAREEFGLVL